MGGINGKGKMIKYILIMQLIFDGYKAGGSSIETVELYSIKDCEAVMSVFLNEFKEEIRLSTIYRKAECVRVNKPQIPD